MAWIWYLARRCFGIEWAAKDGSNLLGNAWPKIVVRTCAYATKFYFKGAAMEFTQKLLNSLSLTLFCCCVYLFEDINCIPKLAIINPEPPGALEENNQWLFPEEA